MANIQKRGDGSYFLTVSLGKGADGKYIRRTKTVHCRTKKEAESEYAKFRQEVEAGAYIAPEKKTFGAFVEEWRDKHATKQLEASTIEAYAFQLRNHILPKIGHKKLSDIKSLHIVDLLDSVQKEGSRMDGREGGLSSTSARFIHRILKDIFARAVEWRIIQTNPVDTVKRPKVAQRESSVLDEEQAAKLFDALEKEPFLWRMLITLALTTGLRRGELLALEWKHIDLQNGVLEVRQSLSHANGKAIIKEPKTKTSARRVSLPASLTSELKLYYTHCRKERLALGDAWEGGDRFFLFSATNGKSLYHTVPGTWLRRFIKRHKLPQIRFHDLRHTSATLLINQGVHAKTIAARLGHADIRTTMNIYGHALQSADQAAADKFDSLLSKRSNA
ncbi:tyrosine-type recombinase/integrase [Cohnella sp. GCM10027633]|uniref:tyrosine-type recombinase/integrase n=1 Tax=unclassified Cohnella TaxID=2636738 RepID=UPI0036403C79